LRCHVLDIKDSVGPEGLQDLLERDLEPEAKDVIMTAGQRLIQQGFEQGYPEGFEQGYQEGLKLGRQLYRESLLRCLRQRVEQDFAIASDHKLETWSARVVSAATLAELFAD
jgi:flagellar biosynthesis/type III secretory pathway protein FliH